MHIDLCRINVFSNVKPNWNASLVWSIDPFIIVFYNQFMKGWNHSTRKKTKLFLLMCMVNQKWQQSSLFLRHGQTMQYWEAVSSLGHKLSLPSKNHFQFRCSVAHIECRPYICTLMILSLCIPCLAKIQNELDSVVTCCLTDMWHLIDAVDWWCPLQKRTSRVLPWWVPLPSVCQGCCDHYTVFDKQMDNRYAVTCIYIHT